MAVPAGLPIPTTWQLALAHTLLKVKPAGTDFKAFLLGLRASINARTSSTAAGPNSSYINTAAHWRGLFQQSQHEIRELQSKIAALTRDNFELKDGPIPSSTSKGKRKATFESTPRTTRAGKRLKDEHAEFADEITLERIDGLGDSVNEDNITYHLFEAQRAIKLQPADSTAASAHLIEAVASVAQLFGDIFRVQNHSRLVEILVDPSRETSEGVGHDVHMSLRAIARVCGIVIPYLSKLQDSDPSRLKHNTGALTWKSADFMDDILAAITNHSQKSCEQQPEKLTSKAKTTLRNGQDKVLAALVRLFMEILSYLDPSHENHLALFDSIVYLVFQRCGRLLYILQFGHERCNAINDEIDMDQATFQPGEHNEEVIKASMEAKSIFLITKRILYLAPYFYKPSTSRTSTIPSKGTAKLSLAAKEKLQQTLVDCIWNEEMRACAERIGNPVFRCAMPALPRKDAADAQSSWFTSELWNLIGWEILGRETS